ncbi:MAG: glycosyltransferase [Thermoanaerobaculia bacterium]
MTTVAVVIPTYDRAALVERAVASVAVQTRAADEIVVVDDGSTDGTAERLRSAFPEVTVLQTENRGVSAARNHGIRSSSGDWIAFLDSDDEWRPEKLEAQLAALAAEPAYRLCHCDEIWIRDGRRVNPRRIHRKYGGRIYAHCLPRCAISPSAAMVARSLFDDVGLFDESLPACEDYDLWLRVCVREPVLYVDRPLVVKYGGHGDQLSRTVQALDRYRIRALVKMLESSALDSDDRRATIEMLHHKIEVYAAGAGKRGRESEVAGLERLRHRFPL